MGCWRCRQDTDSLFQASGAVMSCCHDEQTSSTRCWSGGQSISPDSDLASCSAVFKTLCPPVFVVEGIWLGRAWHAASGRHALCVS